MKLSYLLIAAYFIMLSTSVVASSEPSEVSSYNISGWTLGIVLNKLVMYLALAMAAGGLGTMFTLSHDKDRKTPLIGYLALGCLLGLITATINFFLQVGSFAEEGVSGMFNTDYAEILWSAGAGQSYQLQLIGWCLIVFMAIILWFRPAFANLFAALGMIGAFIIAASFTLTGHTAEAPLWVRIALILHVFIAMWWIGSLYPLRTACDALDISNLQSLMVGFGKQATFLVGLLVVAGVGIAYHLEGSFNSLLDTGHGNLLLLKLSTVAVILLVAAIHKFRYVPNLSTPESAATLKRSITKEMLIGFLILVITAVMSSVTGPAYA